MSYDEYPDDDLDDLRAEVRHNRRQLAKFMAHPDPRDPDHPEHPEHDDEED